ncbi:MAG: glycosyltransferase family 4 protein [Bacteroidota bacterium]
MRKIKQTNGDKIIVQAAGGQYTECHICYTQFCHVAYLDRHWHKVDVKGIRKLLRRLNHSFNAWKEKAAYQNAKLIVVTSQGLKKEIEEYYPGTTEKIVAISNPVDTNGFNHNPEVGSSQRGVLGFDKDDIVIAFAALGDFERKGLGLLLEALSIIRKYKLNYKILVIGGRVPEISLFKNKATLLEVSDQVVFVGFQKDIRPYLWASNMFSLPSIYETFSLVCMQAAAARLPLLVTNFNGADEYVVDNQNGWFVERSASAISAKLRSIYAVKVALNKMGVSAEKTAHLYSQEIFQGRWLKFYNTLEDKETVIG